MNIKKLFIGSFALGVVFLPFLAFAQSDGCEINNSDRLTMFTTAGLKCQTNCTYNIYSIDPNSVQSDTTKDCGTCCLLNTVYNIIDWVFLIIMVVSVGMIIWGAVTYLTSAGNSEKIKEANQRILFAAIGIAVALLSKAVPSVVLSIIK
ncbi:MAG: pilin [Candidatus Pacebacteria bacterium]|nr:pilin [Candidatus Paceibacterota bacterium]